MCTCSTATGPGGRISPLRTFQNSRKYVHFVVLKPVQLFILIQIFCTRIYGTFSEISGLFEGPGTQFSQAGGGAAVPPCPNFLPAGTRAPKVPVFKALQLYSYLARAEFSDLVSKSADY